MLPVTSSRPPVQPAPRGACSSYPLNTLLHHGLRVSSCAAASLGPCSTVSVASLSRSSAPLGASRAGIRSTSPAMIRRGSPCFTCAILSHGPMLDPSEATRKPSGAILACPDAPLHRLLQLLQGDAQPGIARGLLCERPPPGAGPGCLHLLAPALQLLGVLYRRTAERPLQCL